MSFAWVGTDIDITDRKRTEEALAAAHKQTMDILESIADAFYALDAERRFTYANRHALELWGKRPDEVIGRLFTDVFPGVEDTDAWEAQARTATERNPVHIETVSPIIHRWVSISIYPTAGGGLTVYFRDITSRKNAERRQSLLIGELNHRVKNTLAAVQSIVRPRPARHARPGAVRQGSAGAAHSVERRARSLTRTAWEGADLAEVLHAALAPFDVGNQRVRVDGPPLNIQPNVAVALSMAFHEMATNAAKYGALSNANGFVRVTWALDDRATTAIIRWQEAGGPAVTQPTRRGFGSRLIERGLAYELDSEVKLSFPPTGVECEIRLPLPAKSEA